MIKKSYEINKKSIEENNCFLFYGENIGFKNEIIEKIFKQKFKQNIFRYEEKEIIENKEDFYNSIYSKSFFDNEKLIIISRASEKIKEVIENVLEKKIADIAIILLAGVLEKKSKLRSFFEKDKNTVCVPFYADNNQILSGIVNSFFRINKVPISQQTINLLVERSKGDRQNLNNELNKIENFIQNKKSIHPNEILKLTNLAENYNASELIDSCLSKNIRRTINILNENNFSAEDCIVIIRTLLNKSKRLLKLQQNLKKGGDIESTISSFAPPIFWKDKEIVKKQIRNWSLTSVEKLICNTNETELLIKQNSANSINILSNFIISQSSESNS
jgi:DNA polymerase III subunit delta